MVLSDGYDPSSAPYQRAILPLNQESMDWSSLGGIEPPASILQGSRSATDLKQRLSCEARRAKQDGAGWLNQTAASALRRARSVTELNQQKRNSFFSKAGDRPKMTTRHRADLSMWSASKVQAESGDLGVSNPGVLALCLSRQRLDLCRLSRNCVRIRSS